VHAREDPVAIGQMATTKSQSRRSNPVLRLSF
jgi:hypothetical protein